MTTFQLQEPEHEIVSIPSSESDADVTTKIRGIFSKLAEGKYGKKVLLKFEGVN